MSEYENEVKELEAINSQPAKNFFQPLFPENIYDSFGTILNFARELNVQVPSAEFVFIGKQAHGKSQLIDAVLGFPVSNVGKTTVQQLSTKRPVFISLVNQNGEETTKATFRRDLSLNIAGAERDLEVEFHEIAQELEKRQQNASSVPIYIQIPSKKCINVTLIDTPGLPTTATEEASTSAAATSPSAENKEASEVEQTVLSLIRPSNRHIICVEEANEWTNLKMLNFVKKVDPSLTRSTFVLTKFNSHLKTLNATLKLNRYLASQPRDATCFFVTLFSEKVREQNMQLEKFQEKVYQAYRRDKNLVDSLQFDKRFGSSIGIHNLRRFIQQQAWKQYQSDIPEVLKKLRALKRDTQLKLQKLQGLLGQMNSSKLRNIATNYVVSFLQIIEKLIAGTAEGNPSVNGQTLLEEKSYGVGEWFDQNYQEILVNAEKWNIPYWNSRLYGGQQFERLMSEFKAVVQNTKMPEVTLDDIATAAGVNKLNNLPNYAWAGCDIAQQKVRESLGTLIDQLCKRAVFIMKRLTAVVQKIMESRKKKASQSEVNTIMLDEGTEEFDRFPYFVYHVKDLYNEFVEQTAERVKEKCMDEFYSTSTVYWSVNEMQELGKNVSIPVESSNSEKVKEAVTQLSTLVFEELKSRISKNVMLKFYNFFLLPMQSALWNEIQGTVTMLSDNALAEIFEVHAVKEKLLDDEKQLKTILEHCTVQEQEFLKSSTVFSHPVHNKDEFEEESPSAAATSMGAKPRFGPPTSILG